MPVTWPWGYGVQQGRETGWGCQGLQAALEKGITVLGGRQGPQGCPRAGAGVLTVSLAIPHLCFLQWALLGCSSGFAHGSLPCRRFPPLSLPPIIFDTLWAQTETWGL